MIAPTVRTEQTFQWVKEFSKFCRLALGRTFWTILVVFGVSLSASAQEGSNSGTVVDNSTAGPSDEEEKRVEKIEVTGSHIKQLDLEGPNPVLVLDREYIDRQGYNSISDVLRDLTENSFGSARENSISSASDTTTVSLRGQGAARTLVLLNGRRLPKDGITQAPDISMIPMAAIERVDILKESSSATYGSDALGGVVNIVTKKEYSGTNMSYNNYIGEYGGNKQDFSMVTGASSAKSSSVLVFNWRKNEYLFLRDVKGLEENFSPTGSPGSYLPLDSNGDLISTGWVPDPNCPSDQIDPRNRCTYNFNDIMAADPELESHSIFGNYNYDATDSTTFFGNLMATRKVSERTLAPSPDSYTIQSAAAATINNGGPLNDAEGNALPTDSSVLVLYRTLELGNRMAEIENNQLALSAGAKGYLSGSWEWEVIGMTSSSTRVSRLVSGYGFKSVLQDLMNETDSSNPSFNPFNTLGSRVNNGNTDDGLSAVRHEPWRISEGIQNTVDWKVTGELFEMKNGPVPIAVGGIFGNEYFRDESDDQSRAGNVLGNIGSNNTGSRSFQAVFTEVNLPLASTLELQLAARHDVYSDFGSTTNPKIAFRWSPKSWIMLRGSFGTGFRAPSLDDLYNGATTGFPTYIDQKACAEFGGADCQPRQYLLQTSGNEDLNEETSEFWSIGTVVEPVRDFSMGLDFWSIRVKDLISLDMEAITIAEQQGIDVSQFGVTVDRDATGRISDANGVTAPTLNLGGREIFGFDFGTNWRKKTRIGMFTFGFKHSQMKFFRNERFPGLAPQDELGDFGAPAWRNNILLMYQPVMSHTISFTARTISEHEKIDQDAGKLDQYTELDMQYRWQTSWSSTVIAGAKNLFNAQPPIDDSNPIQPSIASSLYDRRGRILYVGYNQDF